jgi:hypothetical protein
MVAFEVWDLETQVRFLAAPIIDTMTTNALDAQIRKEQNENVRFFNENKERIKRQYPGEYVVIQGNKIIDSGFDDARLYAMYKGQTVLIASCFSTLNEFETEHPSLMDFPE